MAENLDPLDNYLSWALDGRESWISSNMKNIIPQSMNNAIQLACNNHKDKNKNEENDSIREEIGKIFEKTNKKYDLYTDKVKTNLELYYNKGMGIEVAHQPKFMGGERFVLNKIACGASFSNFNQNFYPFFYIADYDKVHSELIKTHFSLSNSPNGFSLSIDPEDEKLYNGTEIKNLPLPSTSYLEEIIEKIREQYSFSIKSCIKDSWHQKLKEERLEDSLRLIKIAYYKSKDYCDWFINIIGMISNIINDYGYLFILASDLDFRKIQVPVYEYMLQNHEKYANIYLKIRNEFLNKGYNPPLREISKDFVPFFYECHTKSCYNNRILLNAVDVGSDIIIKGKCDKCKNEIEFSTNKDRPDLADHGLNLTPRVESRQYLVSKTISSAIHVSGTGETRYYTMGIPLMNEFDNNIKLPVIYFYNKTMMNTFITRALEQKLVDNNIPGYLDNIKKMMKNIGKFNKLTRKVVTVDEKDNSVYKIKSIEILEKINDSLIEIDKICKAYKSQNLPYEINNAVTSYLGNFFGTISREKHNQEAVFHWLDLSLKNGLSNIFTDYNRIYQPWLTPGLKTVF
ncbi:MAG: bacillithiol biosynthesis BshC [archaeon]|nr:bacillithiol biosynthesis BshC [archaeon]